MGGTVGVVKDVVVKVGSMMEENQGVVRAVGGTGKVGTRTVQAVEVGSEASGVYGAVKSGLATARVVAAGLSTIPAVGEVLGTIPQIAITGAELVTDVAAGRGTKEVMKNLTGNVAQVAADALPGAGLTMLALKGGLSLGGGAIHSGAEEVKMAEAPGKTPEIKVVSGKSGHSPA